MTFNQLRQQYPRFSYDDFTAAITKEGLKINHFFSIEPDIKFQPAVIIHGVTANRWNKVAKNLRKTWLFHLGLAELTSYWKATASPEIIIKAGYLNQEQIAWWHKLLINGMGEYFYVNQIDFTNKNFVIWSSKGKQINLDKTNYPLLGKKYLVPIGGGKDSALTSCLLNQQQQHQQQPLNQLHQLNLKQRYDQPQLDFDIFLLNPTSAMEQISQVAKPQRIIRATRQIDPKLLDLNQQGYLNGHVPFSAYLAFLSRFVGLLFGHQSVVISNEHSANEGNVEFLGQKINHQYSKSFEFEQNFTKYLLNQQLMPKQTQPAYFSLLRPLYELQISQLLTTCSNFDQYITIIKSCNRGQKTNTWCGECSKCLFSFASFYPFINEKKLIAIFGQNLFDNQKLLTIALALLGKTKNKPFECVGTHQESRVAFYLCCKKIQKHHQPLPILLQLIWNQELSNIPNLSKQTTAILTHWNTQHQVPSSLVKILKNAINLT